MIDGRRQENIIFPAGSPPPSGEYTVRVDASSLCGQAGRAVDGGRRRPPTERYLGYAQWQATDADTRGSHGAGRGPAGVHVHDLADSVKQVAGRGTT